MPDQLSGYEQFGLGYVDYLAITVYFLVLCVVGFLAGRRERSSAEEYFLAGRNMPWFVVGGSFIASTVSTEHFIGLIGSAFVFGVCVANYFWLHIFMMSLMIWFFVPFLLRNKVFTIPEFLERRFSGALRLTFAVLTCVTNVMAFLAAVLYGGGLALEKLFGWNLWAAIILLGVVAGAWAIYGGLRSVAWTDTFTVVVILAGGFTVATLGLYWLSGESQSLAEGWRVMIERNQAREGEWAAAMEAATPHLSAESSYDRLSVIQPASNHVSPWPMMIFLVFSVGLWYNVCNQFIVQRVLGARGPYHARMGMVMSGFAFALMPMIVVLPGLILFAAYPEILRLPWDLVQPEADKGYIHLLQELVPTGLRGLFLAALFGAIQSTVNSVLNSTSTIITLDIFKRYLRPRASEKTIVTVGIISTTAVLAVSILFAGLISLLGGSLFVYIQTLYAFFAPPFAAIFLMGILWKRVNTQGAAVTVVAGFACAFAMKLYVAFAADPNPYVAPFPNQAIYNWGFCLVVCALTSLLTAPPRFEQVAHPLVVDWGKVNFLEGVGNRWYTSVVFWWLLFVLFTGSLMMLFSGLFL